MAISEEINFLLTKLDSKWNVYWKLLGVHARARDLLKVCHDDVIIFCGTGHLCGEFTGPRWIPHKRPVTRSFDVFFDLRLNKRLRKQSWGWWYETPSRSLWRQCNVGELWNSACAIEENACQRLTHSECTLAESIAFEFWNLQDTCFTGS